MYLSRFTQPRALAGAVALALCAVTATGCSSEKSAANQASTDATATTDASATAAASAAATSAVAATDAATTAASSDTQGAESTLPLYPGAVKETRNFHVSGMGMCGHKISIESYHTSDPGKTVAAWYASHVSGSVIDTGGDDSGSVSTMVYTADGSQGAVILQMHFAGALQGAAKTLGADKTTIGFETFDPPLGADMIALMKQASSGDEASVTAARAQLAAKCPKASE